MARVSEKEPWLSARPAVNFAAIWANAISLGFGSGLEMLSFRAGGGFGKSRKSRLSHQGDAQSGIRQRM